MKKRRKSGAMFWKLLLFITVLHGLTCVTMSYLLAWAGHEQVVEMVSQTVVTEIIAPLVVGLTTRTIENIFEKNRLSFSTPLDSIEQVEFEREL